MQHWEAMQPAANYDQHNAWYNSMFAAQIKTEPGTTPSPPVSSATSQLEHYLSMKQPKQPPHTLLDTMTPSPTNNDSLQHFYDAGMQQDFLQQQQQHQHYQQHFQAAQQAAAQNTAPHMPLGFNPLTPPGLPSAVLPPMSHFYPSAQPHLRQKQEPSPHSPAPQLQPSLDAADKLQAALTPRNTPPMDTTPPKSPKSSLSLSQEADKEPDLMSNSSEDMKYVGESEEDEAIRLPIYNSHGKMKNYKCKTCGFVAITKVAFWEHARSHMKPDKVLQCPKCPFVTELKHHLEYHIRKHKNLKPFQCDKCSYSCVNKSMLNSHRKSHSSVYQYRCADCDYATKYCHSFKLHLRKYDHKPGLVLDEEGVPNPAVVIDVYGTRRGPKAKAGSTAGPIKRSNSSSSERQHSAKMPSLSSSNSHLSAALQGFPMPSQQQHQQQQQLPVSPAKSVTSTTSELSAHQQQQQQQQKQQPQPQDSPQHMPNILSPLATIMQQNRSMAFFPYWNLNLQMLAAQQQAAVLAQLSPKMQAPHGNADSCHSEEEENDDSDDRKSVDSAMDLSHGSPTKEEQHQTPAVAMNLKLQDETPLVSSSSSSRRKGRVLKLETLTGPSPSPPTHTSEAPSSVEESTENRGAASTATSTPPTANTSASSTASSSGNSSNSSSHSPPAHAANPPTPAGAIYECKYCDILFKDAVLYTIHMGYHSCDDVFKCNMCGEKCDGPVGLFVHMARNAHS